MAERLDPTEAVFPKVHPNAHLSDEELAQKVREAAAGVTDKSGTEEDPPKSETVPLPASEGTHTPEMQRGDEPEPTEEEPADEGEGNLPSVEEGEDFEEPPVVEPPAETEVRKLTRYVVLESVAVQISGEPVEMWRVVGEFEGSGARDAAHVQLGGSHGALVVVPTRSWNPKRPVEKPRPPVVGWE
jgi:hypothetical protein